MATNNPPVYDTAKIFTGKLFKDSRRCMTVKMPVPVGAATVTVEVLHTTVEGVDEWVPAAGAGTIIASGAYIITFSEKDTRITPAGGAVFSIQ